ncbi:flagellar hook-basal body complex protein FliE [Cellulomonas fimi]|uniref:flagellar hook-basal body complex protein FliE n=1 Tax=Cellulomonas fimi TaxID=1708 RepID=UPI00234D7531|nr:flagellar hook-basal body complex protein FliE [Cellulomonas fimi]MDC7123526.1 flagellar hook-basal body complex protein FliE [Cellulomonas fimi]
MSFAVTPVTGVLPTGALDATRAATPADPAAGAQFAGILGSIENLQQLQSTSNELAVRAVTGDLDDVHDYTIASAQASTALELTAAVRNKAVEAFTEIMRMQA